MYSLVNSKYSSRLAGSFLILAQALVSTELDLKITVSADLERPTVRRTGKMLKGFRSRSKRDSKRSKENLRLDASDSDLNVDTDPVSSCGTISKRDLKEEWRLSGLSRDVGEFARRLLDHLVEGQDATTSVNGELYTAFQKTVTEMQNDPKRQPQFRGTGLEGHQSWPNTEAEGDEQESTPGSEAEHEEGSYCAQADEEDSDETQVRPRTMQKKSELCMI